jgi:hypothetical protein
MANPFGLSWASGAVPILAADEHPVQEREEARRLVKEQLIEAAEAKKAAKAQQAA